MATHELFLDAEALHRLAGDESFHRLLTLAQIVNSLRSGQSAVARLAGAESPSAFRQRLSYFLQVCGLLHQALAFAEALGRHYRGKASYQDGLAALLKKTSTRELQRGLLKRLRDKAVHHFDGDVMSAGLKQMTGADFVFVSSSGPTKDETYYDLADLAVLHFALSPVCGAEDFTRRATEAMKSVVTLALAFSDASDRLIADVLRGYGLQSRIVP